jgi:hypothetical protein
MERSVRTFALAAIAGLCAGAVLAPSGQSAAAVSVLDGRWSGWGSITMSNGSAEQVKCIATYFVKSAGAEVTQNLRCASQSFRIDAVANLDVRGEAVSGKWEERTYSAQGSVSGRLTGSGFNLSIQGENFTAAMAVAVSECKQSITIAPRGFDIARIAVGLDKC